MQKNDTSTATDKLFMMTYLSDLLFPSFLKVGWTILGIYSFAIFQQLFRSASRHSSNESMWRNDEKKLFLRK